MADLQYERFVCGSKTFPDFWGDFKRNPNVILRSFLHFLGNCRSAEDQQVSSPYYTWRQSWKERWKCPLCECNVFYNSLAHKGEPVRVLRLSVGVLHGAISILYIGMYDYRDNDTGMFFLGFCITLSPITENKVWTCVCVYVRACHNDWLGCE